MDHVKFTPIWPASFCLDRSLAQRESKSAKRAGLLEKFNKTKHLRAMRPNWTVCRLGSRSSGPDSGVSHLGTTSAIISPYARKKHYVNKSVFMRPPENPEITTCVLSSYRA